MWSFPQNSSFPPHKGNSTRQRISRRERSVLEQNRNHRTCYSFSSAPALVYPSACPAQVDLENCLRDPRQRQSMPCAGEHEPRNTQRCVSIASEPANHTHMKLFLPSQWHFFHCHTTTPFQLQICMPWGAGRSALSAKGWNVEIPNKHLCPGTLKCFKAALIFLSQMCYWMNQNWAYTLRLGHVSNSD